MKKLLFLIFGFMHMVGYGQIGTSSISVKRIVDPKKDTIPNGISFGSTFSVHNYSDTVKVRLIIWPYKIDGKLEMVKSYRVKNHVNDGMDFVYTFANHKERDVYLSGDCLYYDERWNLIDKDVVFISQKFNWQTDSAFIAKGKAELRQMDSLKRVGEKQIRHDRRLQRFHLLKCK